MRTAVHISEVMAAKKVFSTTFNATVFANIATIFYMRPENLGYIHKYKVWGYPQQVPFAEVSFS